MRLRHYLLAGYLAALALSHGVRFLSAEPEPAGELPAVELPAVVGKAGDPPADAPPVCVAYREWGADGRPAILLLHGSPGGASDFDGLGPLLAKRHRVIAPDLPGFGRSSRAVPDYSIQAHARYSLALLDRLGVEEVQIVGFSMGGGVALHMADLAPERVRSIVMLSAVGVQELELLGQYHLNHALHGLQLAGLWLLHEATPHFGALDGVMLDVAFARNFFDSDQRPLRGILERYQGPMLIVHGRGDVLVPYAAALEHHRLVPQSELVTIEANHFLVFRDPERLVPPLIGFFERVEAGEAPSRAAAIPERLAAAGPQGFQPARKVGLALAVALALIAIATFVSEDLTCIAAGLLVARGSLGFVEAAAACGAGIFFGDLGLYAVGRLGHSWLGRAPLRWLVTPADVERSSRWFRRRGALVILISRFVPGMRLPTYVAAGLLRMPAWWFAINLFVPVVLWTPLLVGLGRWIGDRVFESFGVFQRFALPGFVALLLGVWLLLALARSLATTRGRRLLVGWWLRQRHWEFWPRWRFYPPVVAYVLWLGLRYRKPALFTAANPGLPAAGGFHGESKAEILERLDERWVARFSLIPETAPKAQKLEAVRRFMRDHGFDFPIVLKPDRGLRGAGVAIINSDAEVEAYFAEPRGDVLVQEYVGGPELGVFYLRRPGDEGGRIFSITEKIRPEVVGDGRSTVEQLILADARAVALARVYFRILADQLERVPAAGEPVQLVEVGSHCRGVVCVDGERHGTPELAAAVDRVARSCEGFYFGRLDLRAPSLDAFRAGRDFKVLELNGVTSEATHVYDRRYSVWYAWRVLCEQWRLAFEIGAANRDRGVRSASVGEVLRLLSCRSLPTGRRR